MSNVIQFIGKIRAKAPPEPFTCSLNRALLTAQYCALVLHDDVTACGILQCLCAQQEPLREGVDLPGEYRDAVENVDSAATYRAMLGVPEDE